MLKKMNMPLSAKQIVKMMEKKSISFDNSVQRGLVWDNKRKSLLIDSMIEGYPIPPLYAAKNNDFLDMLDGQQRCDAIKRFINNEFALIDVPEVENEKGELIDINGMKFENLPEEFQDAVKDYSLTIYHFEGITDEEISSLFFRLNNGKPLSAIELTRVKAKSMEVIKEIGKHAIFADALTSKAINKYTNEDITIKAWAILNMENPSFETKKIRPVMEEAEITDEQKQNIEAAFSRILDTYRLIKQVESRTKEEKEKKAIGKSAKRLFTRTHLITIVPIALDSVDHEISVEQFANWCIHFFSGTKSATISEEYNNNAAAGSASTEAIRKRLTAAMSDYNKFIESSAAQTTLEPQQEI